MKKMLMMCALCAVFVIGLGLTAFAAAPTVTSVTAQQRSVKIGIFSGTEGTKICYDITIKEGC